MSDSLGDTTIDALRLTLGRTSRRAALVASNLANLDTPGYHALQLTFEQTLASASRLEELRTHPGHLSTGAEPQSMGKIEEAPILRMRQDGNTVDVDREMTMLTALQGRYQAAAEMVRKRFALLVYTATDGRSG